MLSGNLFQFDEFQQNPHPHSQGQYQVEHQRHLPSNADAAAVGDLRDYLTCDLKLSDSALNDFFSDFDMNANDFQSFDALANHVTYAPLAPATNTVDLPPPYDTVLLAANNNAQASAAMTAAQPPFQQYHPPNNFKTYLEPHQVQYAAAAAPTTQQTNYSETSSLLSMEVPEHPNQKSSATRKQSTNKRTRANAPVHLPKLIKKPEPIPVTLDQFQALICSAPDTNVSHVGTFSSLLENSTIIGNNIPLKIVNQSNQMNNLSSDENSRHDSPLSNHSLSTSSTGVQSNGTGRVRRKSSHNAIEKRYRSSINERILELKEIVADTDEKVQKSGVLRRTIEYIRQLQSVNRRLEEENNTLKTILKRLNLSTNDLPSSDDSPSSDRTSSVKNITTPPSSHDDSSDEAFSPVPKRQKPSTSKQGMVNGSRLVLCCFMLCVLITNPFSYLLNLIHASDSNDVNEFRSMITSRTLQSATTNNENLTESTFLSSSWRQLVAWMLNLAICLVCLVKLFVYGEPIISESEMQEYQIDKKKADQLMAENLSNEARLYYRQCCEKLCVNIDQTLLYYLSSITWQMTRFSVNLIVLGRWLTFWSGWTKSIDTRDYNRELNHCLLHLWKIEYQSRSPSSLALFNFFISTINTSMNAGKKIDGNKRNEIYLLSVLTLNHFGGIFTIFIPYLIKSLQLNDFNDLWLIESDRLMEFLLDKQRMTFQQGKLIESIRQQFLEYNLLGNIRSQLQGENDGSTQQSTISIKTSTDLDYFTWWQHVLQLIRSISDEKQSLDAIHSSDALRENRSTLYHWARSMHFIDERYIHTVQTIHRILLVLNDDEEQKKSTTFALLEQLGKSSRLIISMAEPSSNSEDQLEMATKMLILDGILALRLRLLTSALISDNEKLPYLDDFQQELDHYRVWNSSMKLPKQRLYLFESIFRVSSGLNPMKVQTSFESAVKQQSSALQMKQESPQLDLLAALLLFCHFAPSTVFHYRTILQQAAFISPSAKKNNDLSRLRQQCLTLIRQPYLTL